MSSNHGDTYRLVTMVAEHKCPDPERRGFFKRASAVVISAFLGLVPLGAGLAVLLDPLRRKTRNEGAVRVAFLDALPQDGVPRKFPVVANRTDAWNKFTEVPIGAVYLRRTAEGKVEALNVVCPHAGCFVDFKDDTGQFICPCHLSSFAADGKINDPNSPSPRALDSLELEIRNDREVWVKFQNFRAGVAEKIPVA
jgi:menaquinol-cytochrome c reductase iron-sulfur subunit